MVIKQVSILIALVLAPSLAFAGSFNLSGSQHSHVSKGYSVSGGISDTHGPFSFSADYAYGKDDGEVTTDKGSVNLDYDAELSDSWKVWFDYRAAFNKPWGIRFENQVGVGPKYYVIKNSDLKVSLSTGVLYHYQEGDAEGRGRYSHRLKAGTKNTAFVVFYQPNIRDDSDFIKKARASLKLTDVASVYYKEEYRSLNHLRSTESGIQIKVSYDSK